MSESLHISNTNSDLSLEEYDSDASVENNQRVNNVGSTLIAEKQIASDQVYILHVSGTMDKTGNVAFGMSNNVCSIYHCGFNHLAKLDEIKCRNSIVGVLFSYENNNLLYIASTDGSIKLWDLRCLKQAALNFVDTTSDELMDCKSILCFDVSPNNRLLAAGTDLYEGESFMLFWDIRNVDFLGGYWESHTDDITEIKFHPNDVNKLASGSTDGLINIYDLNETSEDDALVDSLNTESSVERLLWYTRNNKDCLACVTHTVDLQLWQMDKVEPYVHFKRSDINNAIYRKSASHCYIANVHKYVNDEMFVLAGSNWNNGEYIRGARSNNTKLVPAFKLNENKQRVRSSWYNQYHNVLVTGGEQGIINVWELNENL